MNADARELITWILGTTISLSILLGLAVKFVLMPYLKEHLVRPMKQVEKQVSENAHANKQPTVLDRIDDVKVQVESLSAGIEEARADRLALHRMFAEHSDWSQRWVDVIEREIALLRRMEKMERDEKKHGES